ncbi:MAG: sigma-E factor negative regulatory protein [Sulfuricaulis sp.]|nr:sigma-E factor negative regulatory protein [Sulfuricaulis sp.]
MNNEHLKEKLSALVDNELDELEERRVFTALEGDVALRRTWERYHLVRAALHQDVDVVVAQDAAEQVARRIDAEPSTAVSFRRHRVTRFIGTLAIAASVAAIAITGVQWVHQPVPALLPALAANTPAPQNFIRSGTTRWDMKEPEAESALNAYLVEHDEFASTSGLGGMMPYVRIVSYDNNK